MKGTQDRPWDVRQVGAKCELLYLVGYSLRVARRLHMRGYQRSRRLTLDEGSTDDGGVVVVGVSCGVERRS
jgi:hypothetical protein